MKLITQHRKLHPKDNQHFRSIIKRRKRRENHSWLEGRIESTARRRRFKVQYANRRLKTI